MAALFGSRVRRLRTAAGLTQAELGEKTHVVASRITQVERTSGAKPTLDLARALDQALGADDLLVDLWPYVYRETFPDWSRAFMTHAERAVSIRQYAAHVVPGLLQTEAYARALLGGDDQAVAARLGRQSILSREDPPPPKLHCVLAEAVLHNQIGDAATMREQLEHLAASVSPRLSVQIVPYGAVHLGIQGSFVIADVDGGQVAYVETAVRGMTLGSPEDLAAATDVWESVRTAALSQAESLELIKRTAERWT